MLVPEGYCTPSADAGEQDNESLYRYSFSRGLSVPRLTRLRRVLEGRQGQETGEFMVMYYSRSILRSPCISMSGNPSRL